AARAIAATVPDPELPMVTVADLGILRDVGADGGHLVVTITPTYSGCPAMREIAHDVKRRLTAGGFAEATVRTALAPPWSSDWITAEGRRKLREAGIAPPHPAPARPGPVPLTLTATGRNPVTCPRCGADRTPRCRAPVLLHLRGQGPRAAHRRPRGGGRRDLRLAGPPGPAR